MEQRELFIDPSVKFPTELDAARYAKDRGECKHPTMAPATAYRYGCRCRGCYKFHAADNRRRKDGPLPCAADDCTNPRRRVQGAKYCAAHATCRDYELTGVEHRFIAEFTCELCGMADKRNRSRKHPFCAACNERLAGVIHQAATHHVRFEQLVDWVKRGTCGLCDRELYFGKSRGGRGGRGGFAIDHNHQCCDVGRSSCGACVRDVLCNQCNIALGFVESIARRVGGDKVAAYLAKGRLS